MSRAEAVGHGHGELVGAADHGALATRSLDPVSCASGHGDDAGHVAA